MSEDQSARGIAEVFQPLAGDRATSMDTNLPRSTSAPSSRVPDALFEIAVAAMWSDGALVAAEVERGRALTRHLHARPQRGGSPFGAIAEGALPFAELEFDHLQPDDQRLAYAVAQWVTAANAQPSSRRAGFLRGLQLRLRIDDRDASMLQDVVRSVDETSGDAAEAFGLLLSALSGEPQ